jgi:hypothetical protein
MSKKENCNKLTCWEPVYKCLNQTPKLPPNTAEIKVDLSGQTFPVNTTDLFSPDQAAEMNLQILELEDISGFARSGNSLYKYFAPVSNQLLKVITYTSTTINNAFLEIYYIQRKGDLIATVLVSTIPIRSTPTRIDILHIGGNTNNSGFFTRVLTTNTTQPKSLFTQKYNTIATI